MNTCTNPEETPSTSGTSKQMSSIIFPSENLSKSIVQQKSRVMIELLLVTAKALMKYFEWDIRAEIQWRTDNLKQYLMVAKRRIENELVIYRGADECDEIVEEMITTAQKLNDVTSEWLDLPDEDNENTRSVSTALEDVDQSTEAPIALVGNNEQTLNITSSHEHTPESTVEQTSRVTIQLLLLTAQAFMNCLEYDLGDRPWNDNNLKQYLLVAKRRIEDELKIYKEAGVCDELLHEMIDVSRELNDISSKWLKNWTKLNKIGDSFFTSLMEKEMQDQCTQTEMEDIIDFSRNSHASIGEQKTRVAIQLLLVTAQTLVRALEYNFQDTLFYNLKQHLLKVKKRIVGEMVIYREVSESDELHQEMIDTILKLNDISSKYLDLRAENDQSEVTSLPDLPGENSDSEDSFSTYTENSDELIETEMQDKEEDDENIETEMQSKEDDDEFIETEVQDECTQIEMEMVQGGEFEESEMEEAEGDQLEETIDPQRERLKMLLKNIILKMN